MATLKFDITADDSNFRRTLDNVRKSVKDASSEIERNGQEMDSLFQKLTASIGEIGAAFAAKSLIQSIVQVRGEFQQLEVAFSTILRSEERANKLMQEAAEFAAITPFDLQGVAGGIRQLLAYGTAAEDAIKEVEMLGNVAAGLSVPLNDMIYLYGTLRSQGRAFTVDIRQFAGRGVPIYEELGKVLNVDRQELNQLITDGKVGFAEVEQAFKNMTSEGGMFFNLMREQSKTITGQISNLRDSIDMMFNELGKNAESVITDVISGASYIVDHYKEVIRILGSLIATYGSYRATLILVAAAQKTVFAAENVRRIITLATGVKTVTQAFRIFNTVLRANPIGLFVSLITGLVAGFSSLIAKQKDLQKEIDAAIKPLQDEYIQVNSLVSKLNDANIKEDERLKLLDELKKIAPDVVAGIDSESESLAGLNARLEEYNNMQMAEIAVKRFSIESGFDESLEDLTAAKEKLQQESADLYDVYSQLYMRFEELDSKGLINSDDFKSSIEEVFNDAESTVTEKVEKLFALRKDIESRIRQGGGIYVASAWSDVTNIFGDLDIDDYEKRLDKMKRAEENYADHAEDLATKIRAIAESAIPDIEDRESFILKMYNAFGLEGGQEEGGNSNPPGNIILPKDFDTQVEEAKTAVENAKKTLADLMAGILPADAGKDFDFASAIQAAEEEYKAAQERYNTLTGSDPKAIQKAASDRRKAEKDAAQELADVNERIAKEEYELQRKNTDDKLELIRMEKEQALKVLQDELTAAKAVYEKIGLPTDELEAQYQKLADLTAKSYDSDTAKEIQSQFDAVLKEVETYEQARLRIQEEYAEKRKMLMNEDGTLKDGVTQGNLDELTRQEQEAIDAISVTFAMRDEAFEQWSKSLAGKTADALELLLAEAEEELSILEDTAGADPEDVAKATAAIDKLKKALANANKENKDSEVTWTDLNDVLQDSASVFTELGEKIPGVAGEILSTIGNIATSAVSMANAIKGIGEAASAAEKASAILAVISAAIKVLSFVTDTINENKEANEAATQAAWEYAEALEQIQINSRLEKYDTIFGENAFGKMLEQADIAKDAIKSIQDIYAKGTETTWLSSTGRINKDSMEGSNTMYRFTASKEMKELLKLNDELGNMSLVSDMRSGWQKFWDTGHQNVHIASLNDFLDEDGILDPAKLQEWYNAYGEGMTDENKQIVESLIQDGQILQDAMDGIAEYAKSLFGDVSSSVADSMITAFEETGDAANATFDEISQNIARNFAKNAIMDILSREIFTPEAEETMSKLIATDSEGALEYFDSLMGKLQEVAPEIAESLNGIYGKYANSAETDETDHDRTSSAKGIAQASQDSVDELNGRATVIQSHTFSISNDMKTLVNTSAMMLDRLAGIESNTAHLEMIDNNIASLNKEMGNLRSDLTMRGIKLAR